MVKYLSCLLGENMSEEAMARTVSRKVNGNVKFYYRQGRYLSYPPKRMLYNTLIQPLRDFVCCSWYPTFSMSLGTRLE